MKNPWDELLTDKPIPADEYRRLVTSEHDLQVLVVDHVKVRGKRGVRAVAIANEGKRSLSEGARLKARGLVPGMADLLIVLPAKRCAFLELKRGPGGRMSVEQKGVQAWLIEMGHDYGVARNLDEAIAFLEQVGALR